MKSRFTDQSRDRAQFLVSDLPASGREQRRAGLHAELEKPEISSTWVTTITGDGNRIAATKHHENQELSQISSFDPVLSPLRSANRHRRTNRAAATKQTARNFHRKLGRSLVELD
jgi:hypothetical protein